MDSKTIGILVPTRDFVNSGFAFDLALAVPPELYNPVAVFAMVNELVETAVIV